MTVTHWFPNSDRGYFRDDTGEKVPGVSAIKGITVKPALETWKQRNIATFAVDNPEAITTLRTIDRATAIKVVMDACQRVAGEAAASGTNIHALAERVMLAVLAGRKPAFRVTHEERKYLRNLARFISEYNVRPVWIERKVWSEKHAYAGTLDLMAWLTYEASDVLAIVDYKSGASGVWPDTAFQQKAYQLCDHHLNPETDRLEPWPGDLRPTHAFGMWLRPDGWALHPLVIDDEMGAEVIRRRGCYEYAEKLESKAVLKAVNENPLKRKWKGNR